MKIVLSPVGTTGDIRPFIALGNSLRKSGNEILLVVPQNAADLCKKYGLPHQAISFDYRMVVDKAGEKLPIKEISELLDSEISAQCEGLKETVKDADFLIGSARNYAVPLMAELYGISYYQVWHTVQVFKSVQHPPWRVSRQNNPEWLNSLFWKVNDIKENAIGKKFINKHRKNCGLKPLEEFCTESRKNILAVVDKELAPVPSDVTDAYYQTRYWHLFENEELASDLMDFVRAGKPPVFFSFGSMSDKTGEQTVEIIEKIVKDLDLRAVIQKGWADLGKNLQNHRIKVIDAAPHHKLFPWVSAVVHHGGAGTTHTAALAGVPQVIVPQMVDQFYWGAKVHSLKLGPHPINKSKLAEKNLKEAVSQAVYNPTMIESARKMAHTLSLREDMDTIAEELLERICTKIRNRR